MATTFFWPERSPDQTLVPETPDPGMFKYLSTTVRDALYHSPASGVYRFAELAGADSFTGQELQPEEATKKYGIPGELQFFEPINDYAAQIMQRRKFAEIDREAMLGLGANSLGRRAAGFGTSLIATILDPINLASMFVPVVGEAKFAQMVTRFGGSLPKARLAAGAVEGLVGSAMVEPFVLLPALYEGSHYGMVDSAMNLGFGAVLGGPIHALAGSLGDDIGKFRQSEKKRVQGMVDRLNQVGDAMRVQSIVDKSPVSRPIVSPDTQHAAMSSAVADVLNDRPVTSPGDVVKGADEITLDEAKFDAKRARDEALKELGFDVEQAPTYNLYPDKSVADPMPNEPWFHGRPHNQHSFEEGRIAWFTRDRDYAVAMVELRSEFPSDTVTAEWDNPASIFVSNIEPQKIATINDLLKIYEEVTGRKPRNLEGIEFETGEGRGDPLDTIPAAIEDPRVFRRLRELGFDAVLFKDYTNMTENELHDTVAILDPNIIKTPGRRPQKTETGVFFADGREMKRSLEKRVNDLREAKIKNLVERKKREHAKRQAEIESARKQNPVKPTELVTDDLDAEHQKVMREIEDLNPGILEQVDLESMDIPPELREAIQNVKNEKTVEDAIRAGADCVIREMS